MTMNAVVLFLAVTRRLIKKAGIMWQKYQIRHGSTLFCSTLVHGSNQGALTCSNSAKKCFAWHSYVYFPPVWNLRTVTSRTAKLGSRWRSLPILLFSFRPICIFASGPFISRDAFIHPVISSYSWCSFKVASYGLMSI